MRPDNPFDKKMEIYQKMLPAQVQADLQAVCDSLDFGWAAAQAVFEKRATPEHALAICSLMEARLLAGTRKRRRKASDA